MYYQGWVSCKNFWLCPYACVSCHFEGQARHVLWDLLVLLLASIKQALWRQRSPLGRQAADRSNANQGVLDFIVCSADCSRQGSQIKIKLRLTSISAVSTCAYSFTVTDTTNIMLHQRPSEFQIGDLSSVHTQYCVLNEWITHTGYCSSVPLYHFPRAWWVINPNPEAEAEPSTAIYDWK